MDVKIVFVTVIFLYLLQPVWCTDHHVDRRSNAGDPKLQMTISHFLNTSRGIIHGSQYEYTFIVKHSPDSLTDALGVHVTWMLTPFVKFDRVTSSALTANYVIQQKGDSVTFKLDNLLSGNEAHFNFSVTFDSEALLRSGRHHIVTPVQLLYYKEYTENQQGEVQSKGAPFSIPLQTVAIAVEIPGCSLALGMASGAIKDYQLTASSTYSESQPNQARPGVGHDAWCAFKTNDQQFIQLDFTRNTRVTRIVTYGRNEKIHWVKRYVVQYSYDNIGWHNYTENGFTKEFPGNFDTFTPVSHYLANEIEAYSIRLRPLAWEKLVCLRFEVYGCSVERSPENCIYPLGLESGYIPDEALSHSVDTFITLSNPADIRLNKKPAGFPNGWQAGIGEPDYLQVDFGSLRKVTRVATQGSGGSNSPFFVKSFKFKYSNNSIDWREYEENGQAKELSGPKDIHEAKYSIVVKLVEPITARYVRFIPTEAPRTLKIMRAELYGCLAEPTPPYDGVPEYSRRSIVLDPVSNWLYVCMYAELSSESSCFSSNDGQDWTELDEFIIGVIALDPRNGKLFGVDRRMNFHLSTNKGGSWKIISPQHFYDVKNLTSLIMSKGVPDNMVSVEPESFWSESSSDGRQWAVTASGIHMMAAGQNQWSIVAAWRCCGN